MRQKILTEHAFHEKRSKKIIDNVNSTLMSFCGTFNSYNNRCRSIICSSGGATIKYDNYY